MNKIQGLSSYYLFFQSYCLPPHQILSKIARFNQQTHYRQSIHQGKAPYEGLFEYDHAIRQLLNYWDTELK